MKNFKIKFNKTLDEMNGLDLTAIAYAVGLLVGLLWDINLTIVFTLTSGLCAWVSSQHLCVYLLFDWCVGLLRCCCLEHRNR